MPVAQQSRVSLVVMCAQWHPAHFQWSEATLLNTCCKSSSAPAPPHRPEKCCVISGGAWTICIYKVFLFLFLYGEPWTNNKLMLLLLLSYGLSLCVFRRERERESFPLCQSILDVPGPKVFLGPCNNILYIIIGFQCGATGVTENPQASSAGVQPLLHSAGLFAVSFLF